MFMNYSCHYILIVETTFKNELLLCVEVGGCTDAMAHVRWKSENNFWKLVLILPCGSWTLNSQHTWQPVGQRLLSTKPSQWPHTSLILICVCVCNDQKRIHTKGVHSFLPSCWSLGSNSGQLAWRQTPSPTGLSPWTKINLLIKITYSGNIGYYTKAMAIQVTFIFSFLGLLKAFEQHRTSGNIMNLDNLNKNHS